MHQPVMLKETISSLNLKKGSVVLDATIGGGGHSAEILKRIAPGGRLIGIDADKEAIDITRQNLKDFKDSLILLNDNFRNIDTLLPSNGIDRLNAALFDIGVSSYQLENPARGFSIRDNGPLDMRMDQRLSGTAYDIVNKLREKELSDIIRRFGEERFHNRIARAITERRSKKPIETTHELAGIVRSTIGHRAGSRIDQATRTFQAIRIAVNDELGALEDGLKKTVSWLDIGARIAVITFHSLEDRIVKNLFKGYSELGVLKIITKKPVVPGQAEIIANPRSRSAKLRVAERM